ncbi:MAG: glycosyl hydrolase family 2 [Duncaniella sp.]|nr:glycosyl hydrolase family 2 [Duncaniella sp.]
MPSFRNFLFLLLIICIQSVCAGQVTDSPFNVNDIYGEFESAPDSTRTKVWWFHGETVTTHEGITADLETFKQAGVGGVVYYDQVHGDAKGAFPVFSVDWWDSLIFAAAEAKRLGLTFEINLSNGFVAGGPWITKEMSMKKLCKSETLVTGGSKFDSALPLPADDEFWDVAVVAFPVPKSVKWEDRNLVTEKIVSDKPIILTYDMGETFTARSLTYSENTRSKAPTAAMNIPGPSTDEFYGDGFFPFPHIGTLEVSSDGVNYKKIREIPPLYNIHSKIKTISFPAVSGRFFRLNLHDWNRPDSINLHPIEIRSAILSSKPKTDQYEARAGFVTEYLIDNLTPHYSFDEVIKDADVLDLTSMMDSTGYLKWTAPSSAKEWVIMRVAQTSTKGHVKHGRPGQIGLECDKLLSEAAELQWNNFAKIIIDTLSKRNLKPQGVVMDSHEMGAQNWTHDYDNEFARIQGYEITKFLPALFGYIINSKDETDKVLFNHRQTLATLVNNRYFTYFDSLAVREGVNFTPQAMGNNQGMVCDNISAKGAVRRPQGEFWAKHIHGAYDINESSSAAHLYGKQIASAEAFTDARYSQTFAYLKSLADYAYAAQLNEFVVCASAYQPWLDRMPGNTANGREYCLNRNNTMWNLSKGFWDYQSRCAYMLRQGSPVVDILVYLGSEYPMKLLSYRLPEIPEGYNWDVCTDDALLNQVAPFNGNLMSASGNPYKILVIEKDANLSSESEQRIAFLKSSGVRIYDGRIRGSHELSDYIGEIGLMPDIDVHSGDTPDNRILFAHRTTGDIDIYFIANHSDMSWFQRLTFRDTRNRHAEYWNPSSGRRYRFDDAKVSENGISLGLALKPYESGFVLLHNQDTKAPELSYSVTGHEDVWPINAGWTIDFKLPHGSKTIGTDSLFSWSESLDRDIKYHSGTAFYSNKFLSPTIADGRRCYIRINGLEGVSKIALNGRDAGYLWCSPWEIDITDSLNNDSGLNELIIEVSNQLTNRMIGDIYSSPNEKVTFATTPIVKPGDPLLPAGITDVVEIVVR